jgi:hypothetical protein
MRLISGTRSKHSRSSRPTSTTVLVARDGRAEARLLRDGLKRQADPDVVAREPPVSSAAFESDTKV